MAIASRYGSILEREGADLSPGSELTEPIHWWLQATTGSTDKPKKNSIIGFPGVPANTLLPDLAHHFREGTRGGASSSSSAPNRPSNMPDQLFIQVVRNVRNAVTAAQANPGHFQRQMDNAELEGLARNLVEVSDPESRGNLNTVFFRGVVNVVTDIMNDICNKYEAETQAAIEEANKEYTDGESSENDEYLSEDGGGRKDGAGQEDGTGGENEDGGDAEM